jgi:hypothetical protein
MLTVFSLAAGNRMQFDFSAFWRMIVGTTKDRERHSR